MKLVEQMIARVVGGELPTTVYSEETLRDQEEIDELPFERHDRKGMKEPWIVAYIPNDEVFPDEDLSDDELREKILDTEEDELLERVGDLAIEQVRRGLLDVPALKGDLSGVTFERPRDLDPSGAPATFKRLSVWVELSGKNAVEAEKQYDLYMRRG